MPFISPRFDQVESFSTGLEVLSITGVMVGQSLSRTHVYRQNSVVHKPQPPITLGFTASKPWQVCKIIKILMTVQNLIVSKLVR